MAVLWRSWSAAPCAAAPAGAGALDGAEGVDEMVAISPVPAIVNAINNALDLDISDIPVTPEALLRALDEQTAGCSG